MSKRAFGSLYIYAPVPTPAQLRKMADEGRARAADLRARADVLEKQSDELDRLASISESSLPDRKRSGNVNVTEMTDSHAMAISRAHAKRSGRDLPFKEHIAKKGYTLNTLAAAAGCSGAALSRYRDRGARGRQVTKDVQDKVKALTGWTSWPRPATD